VKLDKKCRELYEKANNNPAGIRFKELNKLCECAGLKFDRSQGSHFIYKRENPSFILSIQKMRDGKAKPYQVRQLLDFIKDHSLNKGE